MSFYTTYSAYALNQQIPIASNKIINSIYQFAQDWFVLLTND